jgi:uncharacterized protein (TIGR03663 family)
MICPKCGAENPGGNRFCDNCGAKLSAAASEKKDKERERPKPERTVVRTEAAPVWATSAPSGLASAPVWSWLTGENLLWLLLFVVAGILRFYALGDKPLHHDESLHAFYSWNLFRGNGYAYDPMMHGPFQFHANALMYFLFGASNTTCRLVAACSSMFCLGVVYLLRPQLGRAGALFGGLLMTLSPSFTYFGRFTREDIYFAAFSCLMIYGLVNYLATRKPRDLYLGAAGLALAFCTKEVIYILGFIIVSFLAFRWLWENTLRPKDEMYVTDALQELLAQPRILGAAAAVFGIIMIVLYTTVFSNPRGILDAFTKSLTYWMGQHEVQRGSQPVYFYAALLPWYETVSFLGALMATVYFGFVREKQNRAWRLLGYLILVAAWWLFTVEGKQTFGLVFSLLLVTLGVGMLAYFSFGPKNLFVTFLIFWSLSAFSDMSFAGERMPWLILHSLLPMLLLTAAFLNDLWERFPRQRSWILGTVAVFAALLLHNTTLLCFYQQGANPAEQLVYVQTSPDVPQVVRQIVNLSQRLTGGTEMKITCEDYCSWPFAWYLRDFKNVGYPKYTASQAENSIEKNPIILSGVEMAAPGHDERVAQLLAADYVAQRYKLRVWWAADASVFFNDSFAGQVQKIWRLFVYREPWNGLGSYDMIVYVRKDIAYLYWSNAGAAP